jgi:hypothetical protein
VIIKEVEIFRGVRNGKRTFDLDSSSCSRQAARAALSVKASTNMSKTLSAGPGVRHRGVFSCKTLDDDVQCEDVWCEAT